MNKSRAIALATTALLAIVLIAQNTEPVDTRLLFVTVSMPLAILLLTCVLIGFTLGVLSGFRKKRVGRPEQP